MNWKNTSTLLIGALVLGSLIVLPAMASAFMDVPNCKIKMIGSDHRFNGTPPVFLDDPTDTFFTGAPQFFLHPDLGNQGLAILLTAFSMGSKVWVRIEDNPNDPTSVAGSLISIVYVQSAP
ncbi:MAG: hypothetical protein ACQ9MH_24190 [Nitrospinales bacterium]